MSGATRQSPTDTPHGTDVPSREAVFEVLSNERRRYVVHHLRRTDGPAELGGLSQRVAAWENEKELDAVTATERRRVYNALQQSHLPKMERNGLVNYDTNVRGIETTEAFSELEMYLEVVPEADIPWSSYYLLLGAFCTLLVSVVAAGLPPFDPASLDAVAVFTSLLFTGSAAVHVWNSRRRMRIGGDGPPEF